MRVTRESLIRIARENSQERSFNDRSIIAAYLTGSLLGEVDPMLGGTTDVDLVFVHNTPPPASREIVKLTPDFHLDIRHRSKSEFKSARELRTDPYLGYEMYDPMLLSQREKFFEFVQAGLRAGSEFHAPALVLARCRRLLAQARQGWLELSENGEGTPAYQQINRFLQALKHAANTVAELSGGPLPERRFLLEFPARALAAERPDFTASLFTLLGADQVDAALVSAWLPAWAADFLAAAQDHKADISLHSARLNYYDKGMRALLEGDSPLTALWPLIQSWTLAAQVFEAQQSAPWEASCRQLGLMEPAFAQRVSGLDAFLDQLEVRLDEIAQAAGVETSSLL